MGFQDSGRPRVRHIDSQGLNALVPLVNEDTTSDEFLHDVLLDARLHVASCEECSRKVAEYRNLFLRIRQSPLWAVAQPGSDCPSDEDVWYRIAGSAESNAEHWLVHAGLCAYCGPRLRAAAALNDDPTAEEEEILEQLRAPFRPVVQPVPEPVFSKLMWSSFLHWRIYAPALAVVILAIGMIITSPAPASQLSGPSFAEYAVTTHRLSESRKDLEIRTDSQEALNAWLQKNTPFDFTLPTSEDERPYRIEGAQLLPVSGKTGVYIAYRVQNHPAGLIVTPDSVAKASGGAEAKFAKVTFHYRTLEGYKVVTWSLHGNTYALVSQEGNNTQTTCMICHSGMKDRDLSQTPTPLRNSNTL